MPGPENNVSRSTIHQQLGAGSSGETRTAPFPPANRPTPDGEPKPKNWISRKLDNPRKRLTAGVALVTMAAAGIGIGVTSRGSDGTPLQDQDPDITLGTGRPVESVPTSVTAATAPPTTEAPSVVEQRVVDDYLTKAGYPELKGTMPTFRHEVVTNDANTHVLSFLPDHILPPGSFNKDAYTDTLRYIESIAAEERTFTWNMKAEGGQAESRKFVPRKRGDKKNENFVVLFAGEQPVPQILSGESFIDPLKTALRNGTTFFWTTDNGSGTSSFLRFAEASTWQYGLATDPPNKKSTTLQQLNLGLTLEAWTATGIVSPNSLDATETLKNPMGQAIATAQENLPVEPLASQRLGKPTSPTSHRRNYPDDAALRRVYNDAPRVPSIA